MLPCSSQRCVCHSCVTTAASECQPEEPHVSSASFFLFPGGTQQQLQEFKYIHGYLHVHACVPVEPVTELGDSAARRQRGAPARTPTGIDERGGDDSDAAESEDIAGDAARDGKTHPTEGAALQRVPSSPNTPGGPENILGISLCRDFFSRVL